MRYRRSLRLARYDYSSNGAYFITICTQHRECVLGDIVNGQMMLNDVGRMVNAVWMEMPTYYPGVGIDVFQIMPNHIHGIITIVGAAPCGRPQIGGQPQGVAPTRLSLSDIVHRFKSLSTNAYIRGVKTGQYAPFQKRMWQRNYYEHIIRNEQTLALIREYIQNNPKQWECDANNPKY